MITEALDKLRSAIKNYEAGQKELAKKTGVSEGAISMFANGITKSLNAKSLLPICTELGLDPETCEPRIMNQQRTVRGTISRGPIKVNTADVDVAEVENFSELPEEIELKPHEARMILARRSQSSGAGLDAALAEMMIARDHLDDMGDAVAVAEVDMTINMLRGIIAKRERRLIQTNK